MEEICPERIIRTSSIVADGANPNVIELLYSSNTAYLERITCYILEPVLLRLLICRDAVNSDTLNNCSYPDHRKMEATRKACESDKKLAQIYIRHEKINPKARSCIIIFIEGKYLHETDEIIQIFQNTVNWLNIANEKPFLHVLRYGEPQISLTTKNIGIDLNKKIRKIFAGYSDAEDICIMVSVRRGTKPLIINSQYSKFSITAS